jgi:hypothetical protein
LDLYSGSDYALKANLIEWEEGTVRARTNSSHFFDPSDETDMRFVDFVGEYRGPSGPEALAGPAPFVHFPKLPSAGSRPILNFHIVGSTSGKVVHFDRQPELGLIVSLPEVGEYTIDIVSQPHEGFLVDGNRNFLAHGGDNFFESVQIINTVVTATAPDETVSTHAIIATAAGAVGLCVFVVIVVIINRHHARKAAKARADKVAPQALMTGDRKQGLLEEEGLGELEEFPVEPTPAPFPPNGVRFDVKVPEPPADTSLRPTFSDES